MKENKTAENKIYKRISVGFSKEEIEQIIKFSESNGLIPTGLIHMATVKFLRRNIEKMGAFE